MSLGSVTVTDTASDPHPGDVVRITAAFLNEAAAAADPDTVTLSVRLAGAGATAYVNGVDAIVEKDSVGNYHADYTLPEIGAAARLVRYEWKGEGTVDAVGESEFRAIDPFAHRL